MVRKNYDLRRQAHLLKRLATVIFVALLLVPVVEAVMVARATNLSVELRFLVPFRLAMLFYLAAIWTMRRAFGQIADGALFDDVLPALLMRLGLALAGGAVITVFVTPWLLRVWSGSGRGGFAAFDPPAITIGLVGLLLAVLSRLLGHAVAMRRELDEIL